MKPELDDTYRKRFLIVSTTLSEGGAERGAANFAGLLYRKLYSVDIALMRTIIRYYIDKDITIHDLGKQHLLDNFRAIWRLRQLIRSNRYNIVMSSLSTTSFLVLLTSFTMRAFPFWVARIDGDPLQLGLTEPVWIKRQIKTFLQSWVFRRADSLLTNSFGSRDSALQISPQAAAKLTVLYNPVNIELITSLSQEKSTVTKRPNAITLITVARLEPLKGIPMVLEALAELVSTGLDLAYVICGSGTQLDELVEYAKQLGISDRVSFTGFVKNPYAEFVHADIYILASQVEGLPNALIEAQALGLPAIATNCRSGPSEVIVNGTTGILVPVDDKAAMVAAIKKLACNQELRQKFGIAASGHIRDKFNMDKYNVELDKFLASALMEK